MIHVMVADNNAIQKILSECGNDKAKVEQAINQLYDKWLNDNVVYQTKVSVCCCEEGIMQLHGYYTRQLHLLSGLKIMIRLARVKCLHCNKTHALIPNFIVPYLRKEYAIIETILTARESNEKPVETMRKNSASVDSRVYYSILKSWTSVWKAKLHAIGLTIANFVNSFKSSDDACIGKYSRSFMQMTDPDCYSGL